MRLVKIYEKGDVVWVKIERRDLWGISFSYVGPATIKNLDEAHTSGTEYRQENQQKDVWFSYVATFPIEKEGRKTRMVYDNEIEHEIK